MKRNIFARRSAVPADARHPFRFLSAGITDRGCVRSFNEDAFVSLPDSGLWAVADGMGGHQSGDVASALVIRRLSRIGPTGSAHALRTAVARELNQANAELRGLASAGTTGPAGATVAVLTSFQGYYSCIWAGDSRVYLLRDRKLHRITSDHSLVQALIDAGEISPAEARRHARAHVVTRAVGAAPELSLETSHGEIKAGDRFLLCSDGLTTVLDDPLILELARQADLHLALQALIGRTLSEGAPDNVTTILVDALAA